MKRIAITTGDPGGIGPEITGKAFNFFYPDPEIAYIIYGRIDYSEAQHKIKKIKNIDDAKEAGKYYHIPLKVDNPETGKPTKESGEEALLILNRVANDLMDNKLDAVVTSPVSKEAIRITDPSFIGHTEFFAKRARSDNEIMSFWGPHFNLALLTTHCSICDVQKELPREIVIKKLRIIYKEFSRYLSNSTFAILGFNPHAGENGAFGNEDTMLSDVLQELAGEGIVIDGPYPADTFFQDKVRKYDVVISPYHDQGLIPFKMVSQNNGVNVTLGLPFVRTSVDHGTAYDIAGKGLASEKSLSAAINKAEEMILGRKSSTHSQYNWFAEYYDTYMAHVDYDSWVEFIMSSYIKNRNTNPERILELACGTATISAKLVKKGLNVDASDLSPEMLKIASEKSFAPQLSCHNMLDVIPAGEYDLVLLLFDSVNYLLDSNDVSKLFDNVYSGLKKGGMFIFDISTVNNCIEYFDGFVNLDESDNHYLIHQSDFDDEEQVLTTSLTLFNRKSFLFDKQSEIHKQKIYEVADIVDLIDKSELNLVSINAMENPTNLKDFHGLDSSFNRLFFVLEK